MSTRTRVLAKVIYDTQWLRGAKRAWQFLLGLESNVMNRMRNL